MLPFETKSWVDASSGWVGLIGLVLAAVFGILAVVFYFRPYQSKKLGVQYLTAESIVQLPSSKSIEIKVLSGGIELENPNLITIGIGNAGQQEIRKDDWDEAIKVLFPTSKLVDYSLVDKWSADVNVAFEARDPASQEVILMPLLLNRGEGFKLQFLTDGQIERPQVTARIAGQTKAVTDVDLNAAPRPSIARRLAVAAVLVLSLALLTFAQQFLPYFGALVSTLIIWYLFTASPWYKALRGSSD